MAQVVHTRRPQFLQWCFFRCRTARKVDWHSEHLFSPHASSQPGRQSVGTGGCDSGRTSLSFRSEIGVVFSWYSPTPSPSTQFTLLAPGSFVFAGYEYTSLRVGKLPLTHLELGESSCHTGGENASAARSASYAVRYFPHTVGTGTCSCRAGRASSPAAEGGVGAGRGP